uniref:Dynein light chain n=1 Tax=Esox lucius TaxID=8010 RepID=A0A3P8ZWT2_ESOLU
MAETTERKKQEADFQRLDGFPLIGVRHLEEMRAETVELCVAACETSPNAAKMMKELMDERFGSILAVCLWKCFQPTAWLPSQTLLLSLLLSCGVLLYIYKHILDGSYTLSCAVLFVR